MDSYMYDVFLSYTKADEKQALRINSSLTAVGAKVFIADIDMKQYTGQPFPEELARAVLTSRFFVVLCSAEAAASDWVKEEVRLFYEDCHRKNPRRRIIPLLVEGERADCVPEVLRDMHRPDTEKGLVEEVATHLMKELCEDRAEIAAASVTRAEELQGDLEEAHENVWDAFKYYRHGRFWEPFARNRELHIYTCGRPAGEGDDGRSNRTNIDLWDFQSVLEITHYFSDHFPGTRVRIEPPVAKLKGEELVGPQVATHQADLMVELAEKDCVIIGSPDVSDFAELVMAKAHGIQAYHPGRKKKRGFAILKSGMSAPSATYWEPKEDEAEGIVWIEEEQHFEPTHTVTPDDEGRGTAYGMFLVCDNPFSAVPRNNKIIILAGFTGVATYGLARLLTSPHYLRQFFQVDQEFGLLDENFEVLAGVDYLFDPDATGGDSRTIPEPTGEAEHPDIPVQSDAIRVKEMVRIRRSG